MIKFKEFLIENKCYNNLLLWHKDSDPLTKNKDGSPKLYFHGSKSDFKKFSHSSNEFYFSDNPEFASKWAKNKYREPTEDEENYYRSRRKEIFHGYDYDNDKNLKDYDKRREILSKEIEPSHIKSNVYPVYIKAKKVFLPNRDYKVIEKYLEEKEYSYINKKDLLLGAWAAYEFHPSNGGNSLLELIKDLGYDGLMLREERDLSDYSTIVVFKANQIKSSFNCGLYDEEKEEISERMI